MLNILDILNTTDENYDVVEGDVYNTQAFLFNMPLVASTNDIFGNTNVQVRQTNETSITTIAKNIAEDINNSDYIDSDEISYLYFEFSDGRYDLLFKTIGRLLDTDKLPRLISVLRNEILDEAIISSDKIERIIDHLMSI